MSTCKLPSLFTLTDAFDVATDFYYVNVTKSDKTGELKDAPAAAAAARDVTPEQTAYDAATKNLSIHVKSLSAGSTEQLVLEKTVDLAAGVGTESAWVGFTASTGTALSKQDIYSWTVQASEA